MEGHEGVGRNGSANDVVAFNAHVSFKQWRGDGVSRVQSKVHERPRVQGPEFRAKKFKKNNFPVTVKIRTSAQNLHKCVWRPGSDRTRWGSYSALPDPRAVISGRGGKLPSTTM